MNKYAGTWDEIKKLLGEARRYLTTQPGGQGQSTVSVGTLTASLEEFDEFMAHNEWELAWEALAAVANKGNTPPIFWKLLSHAAGLMELPEKQAEATRKALYSVP